MLEWNANLAVGVPSIDSQHKELIRKLADLAQAMRGGDTEAEVHRLIPFLARYVVDHFATEERLMARYAYPGAASHKLQHQLFIRDLQAFGQQLDRGPFSAALVLGLHRKASDWLVNHIAKTDKLLGAFLKTKQAA